MFKELDYLKSDLEYHKQLLSEIDSEFMSMVNDILERNQELKNMYSEKEFKFTELSESKEIELSKNKEDIDNNLNDAVFDEEINDIDEEKSEVEDIELKTIYRKIVKITHPDKVKNDWLNKIYIDATKYYNLKDKPSLYLICLDLNIEFSMDNINIEDINFSIRETKNMINFTESTYSWIWSQMDNIDDKEKLILKFIKQKITN